jgi:hypothetical protein
MPDKGIVPEVCQKLHPVLEVDVNTRMAWIVVVSIGISVLLVSWCSNVAAYGEITEINVTPDCKRVAVRADGQIGSHSISTMTNPNRLVLDIDGNGISNDPTISGTIAAGVEVRAIRKGSGARIVMNFGHRPIPEHRIRTVGNHLLLFLEGWGVAAGASSSIPHDTIKVSKPYQAAVLSSSADIQIKSAEVANGNIVLKVVDRTNMERTYRIELGVDFSRLGFNTASIKPLSSYASPPAKSVKTALNQRQPSETKPGPRKGINSAEEDYGSFAVLEEAE